MSVGEEEVSVRIEGERAGGIEPGAVKEVDDDDGGRCVGRDGRGGYVRLV